MGEILIASDHGGFRLKEKLKTFLARKKIKVKDLGTYSEERCDYPQFAFALAQEISRKPAQRGILICKSGIGNSIVANKLPNVRAALCCNLKAARLSREHNDANILVLGSIFTNERNARDMVRVWLSTPFAGGRHKRRIDQIKRIEKGFRRK